jgi:hypothetical protein
MLHLKIGSHTKKGIKNSLAEKKTDLALNPEVAAAIGLALHFHLQELEDFEKTAAALQKMMPASSPWSMKIYNITPPPVKFPRR